MLQPIMNRDEFELGVVEKNDPYTSRRGRISDRIRGLR
jgi:hypothetical protein